MFRISSSSRIVLGLVSLVVSALLMSGLLGLIPNVGTSAQKNRSAFCEATAVSFMALAPRMNEEQISETFDTIRSRDEDVESIAVRKEDDGSLVFSSGPHTSLWVTKGSTPQSSREFIVPISASGSRWGQLEVRFLEVEAGPLGNLMRTEFALSLFVGSALFVSFSIYLRKVLRHLNPSQVIPPHVREALDSLAEGLMVMDTDCRIVLANSAFSHHLGRQVEELIGKDASEVGFRLVDARMLHTGNRSLAARHWEDRRARCCVAQDRSVERRRMGYHAVESSCQSAACEVVIWFRSVDGNCGTLSRLVRSQQRTSER